VIVNILDRIAAQRAQTETLGIPPRLPPPSMPQASVLHRMLSEAAENEAAGFAAQVSVPQVRYNAVPDTAELRRILYLPRRTRTTEEIAALAEYMSDGLRTPLGTMRLRTWQALALAELHECGGCFGVLGVGAGKTLISYLGATVAEAERPLLIIPAGLRDKTIDDFRILSAEWNGINPSQYRIETYEALGRTSRASLLEQYQPDFICFDEVHRVKNDDAAVTKRAKRYIRVRRANGLRMSVLAMSGTITKRSIRDFAHIAAWALPTLCPVPLTTIDLDAWCDALDEKVQPFRRVLPGALSHLCNAEQRQRILYGGEAGLAAARDAFRLRLVETPGVVATEAASCDASISITHVEPKHPSPAIDEAFRRLREDWETPDGWDIPDPMTLWRHARELSMGFYYRWNPRPPEEWNAARKLWYVSCREILSNNRRNLDSALQVTQAVDAGFYPWAEGALSSWRSLEPTFKPKTEAVWLSSEALDTAAAWAAKHRGIVWVEHTAFGAELSRRTGLPYYGKKALDPQGNRADKHNPRTSMIASVHSVGTGLNLQFFSDNFVCSAPPNGVQWEQKMGRTHRQGQQADTVDFTLYVGCRENIEGFWQSVRDCIRVQQQIGQAQRLVFADKSVPSTERFAFSGFGSPFRWTKPVTA
jgi:hypothetical protein